jgi:hypothetical protein
MNRMRVQSILLALAVVAAAWGAYTHRLRIETWIWHFRHGNTLDVGDVVVPVPANWHVETLGKTEELLVRVDTADQTPYRRLKAHSSISLLVEKPLNDQDLNRLTSLELAFMKQHAADSISQRTFNVDGGTIVCIGGDKPGSMGIYDNEPARWSCKSSVGLQMTLTSTDSDAEQVWEILSGIRKKSYGRVGG